MNCENGQSLSIFGDYCHDCPIGYSSTYALTSNCSKSSNHFCPLYAYTSKICMDKVNVDITDFCSYAGYDEPLKCPKANKGINFEQCYA